MFYATAVYNKTIYSNIQFTMTTLIIKMHSWAITSGFPIELDPMIANFSMMTPYPGTIVYEQVKRDGRFLVQDWEDYVFFDQKARYEMGDLTADLMEEMYRKAYRQFYWRPKYVARAMSRKDFWLKFGRNARLAWRTVVPRKEKDDLRRAVEAPL